jgi:hypothetical protein
MYAGASCFLYHPQHTAGMVLPVLDKPFRRKGAGGGASGQNPFQDFMVLGAGKSNHNPVIGFFNVLIRRPLPFLYPQHGFIIKGYGKAATLFSRKDAEVAAVSCFDVFTDRTGDWLFSKVDLMSIDSTDKVNKDVKKLLDIMINGKYKNYNPNSSELKFI